MFVLDVHMFVLGDKTLGCQRNRHLLMAWVVCNVELMVFKLVYEEIRINATF